MTIGGLPIVVAGITDGPLALQALRTAHPDADAAFCVFDTLAAGLILAWFFLTVQKRPG